ncbi:beta-1,4-mannosyltransferase egh-like [Mercenaria mercenaria]|uniref:beta-1,4-mannosyltransferase egh-like n=1 Tax=Mercenaria mercenaria TaxID=6596 RepID=UPI00234F5945|nr:beta-1,4-mannosyltransferase egh-like [Mercenaria mercenaria]
MIVHFIKENLPQRMYRLLFFAILLFYIRVALEYAALLIKRYAGYTIEDAINKHGIAIIISIYSLFFTFYLNIPVILFNFLGLFLYNPFDRRVERNENFDRVPFICFRVVTRGLYLKLVTDITEKNIETCKNVGLKNFRFEIVSDSALNLPLSNFVREVIVPNDYNTPNGTLFKARALHYCLDKNVNILSRDDWIVHLDEETLLSETVLNGISNFVSNPNSNIGQGIISYAECGVENWLTTLMEGQREAADYGLYRLAFQFLHRPVFGFHGSFMVIKAGIEEKIGFDFGPKECIAEDLRFALAAWHRGYRFDFVKGVMKENGTFSITDFVKQRRRWFVGHFQIIWETSIPLYCKWALMPMHVDNRSPDQALGCLGLGGGLRKVESA